MVCVRGCGQEWVRPELSVYLLKTCLNYLKKISQTWWSSVGSILVILPWFVSELPEKDISNMVVQCR
jgi:hypothetical protein